MPPLSPKKSTPAPAPACRTVTVELPPFLPTLEKKVTTPVVKDVVPPLAVPPLDVCAGAPAPPFAVAITLPL